HASDLVAFTGQYLTAAGVTETDEGMRLRTVACLLADIGWRAHPDYRGQQSIEAVAYGSLTGVDHPSRAFLSHVISVRYGGLKTKQSQQKLLALADPAATAQARL